MYALFSIIIRTKNIFDDHLISRRQHKITKEILRNSTLNFKYSHKSLGFGVINRIIDSFMNFTNLLRLLSIRVC